MIAQIIAAHAAALTGVELPEIYGRSHRRRPALARHVVWYVLNTKYAWDYYSIAREFNRERQPVMRGIRSVEDQIVLFPDVRDLVRVLSKTDHLEMVQNFAEKLLTLAPCDQRNTISNP
jgi:chromosomal replication initiation ATPase DnaA